nr:vacuolar protein sorting-associated protein 13-like [Dermatophagoides farinae]
MVLSNLVTSLMKNFLSPFVEDFNADQLNIFGWSGQFTLSNVNIKPNAFDSLRLPFRVTHGFISQIEAQVPWMNIYTEPIVIRISDVYAVIVPNTEIAYNEKDEKDYEWQLKKSYLENIEQIKQKLEQESDGSSKNEDDGFFMKLIAAAIKNIQIFISNIHVCYEDSTSSSRPFQIGLVFSRLVFETESSNNVKNGSVDNIINKIIKLEGFAFYLNYRQFDRYHGRDRQWALAKLKAYFVNNETKMVNYILCPNDFVTYAQIDRRPEVSNYSHAIINLDMHLGDFQIKFDNHQVHCLLLLLDAIDRIKVASLYRKWRPTISINDNPQAWWRFLYLAITETGIRRRKREFSWDHIETACKLRRRYLDLYKRKLLGQQKIDEELEELERELNLVVIVIVRAEAEYATKKILKEMEKEKSKSGWFRSWWSSGKNNNEKSVIEDLKKEFTEGEEKEKLYKAIGYEENALAILYPPDYVAHRIQFRINRFNVTLRSEFENIAIVELENCSFGFKNRPCTGNIVIDNEIDSVRITGTNDVSLMKSTVEKKFLTFAFELNPLDKQSDFSVLLEMKSLHFLYDIQTFNHLFRLFTPPDNISLNEIKSAAQNKFEDLRLVTSSQLQNAIDKHKQLKLQIKVEPSFVIIPKKAEFDKANLFLLVSLGEFTLVSKLVPKSNATRITSMTNKDEMKQLIYETYTCHVKNVQVVLSSRDYWQQDLRCLDTERHILCPFEIIINFQHSIVPNDRHFPKINLQGQLPSIDLKASDSQVSQLLVLLSTLPYGPTFESNTDSSYHSLTTTSAATKSTTSVSKVKSKVTDEVIDAMNYAARAVSEINKSKESKCEEDVVDTKGTIIAYRELIFSFKLNDINLTMYRNDRRDVSKLTRFQLLKLSLYGETLSDQTLWVNCTVCDLRIDDIRPQRKPNGIVTMLSKSRVIATKQQQNVQNNEMEEEERSMLTVYVAQKINERIVILTMSGFSLILAVDYILALLDITTKAFSMDDSSAIKTLSTESNAAKNQPTKPSPTTVQKKDAKNSKMMVECSLNKMEIFMLESIDNSNCEAGVFNCSTKVNVKIEEDVIMMSAYIAQINMALTNYLNYIHSGHLDVYIMAPTDLTIKGSIKGTTQMLDFTFDDIFINISPNMLHTILNILAAMGDSPAPPDKTNDKNDKIDVDDRILEPKKIDKNLWYLSYAPQAKDALILLQECEQQQSEQKSNLLFNMGKIHVLIKSGGVESHPLIRIELSTFAKLIENKNFNFECSLSADYYNHSILSWEPLIEPVDERIFTFRGNVALGGETKKIQIVALENLELLLTKSSVNVLNHVNEAFTTAIKTSKQSQMAELNRVIVKNYLGVDINLLMNESNIYPLNDGQNNHTNRKNQQSINAAAAMMIVTGKEYRFSCKDTNDVRLHVNLLISDSLSVERLIICRKSTIRCYFTSIKCYPVDECWKFLVQVIDSGGTKEIIFRSNTQVFNNFDNSFEMYNFVDDDYTYLGRINPHSSFHLPMPLIYGENTLYVKPSDDYELCRPPFLWRQTREREHNNHCKISPKKEKPYVLIKCTNKKTDKQFVIKLRGEKTLVSYEDTDCVENNESYFYTVRMIPLARLKNLLPYTIRFLYSPLNELRTLEPGEEFNLPFIDFGNSVIKFHLLNYLNCDWMTCLKIPQTGFEISTTYCIFEPTNKDFGKKVKITLPVEFRVENSVIVLSLYSTFWVMNRTNETIHLKVDDYNRYRFDHNQMRKPFLFDYDPDKVSKKSKISLAIAESEFSVYFPVDVAPYKVTLTPKVPKQKYSYLVAIRVGASRISLTRIINVEPFYSIINLTRQNIFYSENNEDWSHIESNRLMPFYPKKASNQSICFRLPNGQFDSKHISLRESSQTLLLIDKKFIFVEVDVTELEAKIRLNEYFDGAAPVLIVNTLKYPVFFGQDQVTDWDNGRRMLIMQPNHMAYFCWLDPYKSRRLVYKISLEDDELIDVNIDFDTIVNFEEGYSYVSFLDGKQRVLLFTQDNSLPRNLLMTHELMKPDLSFELILKGFGLNIVDNEKRIDLMYLSIKSTNNWEYRNDEHKPFKAVSIKENDILEHMYQHYLLKQSNSRATVIKSDYSNYETDFSRMTMLRPRLCYLRRNTNRGLWVTFTSSEHVKNIHVRINGIQIDNQLSDHLYAVVFSPVDIPKSISDKYEIERKHFVEFAAIICPGSINRYKHIQLLIQEFMLQIDLGWIYKIANVFDIKSAKEETNKELLKHDMDIIERYNSPDELQKYVMNKSYYDFIMFGPLKLHLNINLRDASDGQSFFLLELLIRLMGSVGEISDTLFRFDYFERKGLFLGQEELVKQVTDHYKNQALTQFYKLILGLDIIGNPMKLALGFKKGIGDFFYEPAVGIFHGPDEFAEGIKTGVKSLASNVIGGTAGALSRIGNRLGTGVATLTIDEKFQKDRRERMNRKTTFTESGKNLFKGIFSGITGVVTKPIEGAKEEGVGGLFKGVGKGVVGIFAQPTTSVIDFASGSLQAFNNAIDPKKIAQPARMARNFNREEIRPYSHQEANGYWLLKTVTGDKYKNDTYVYHAYVSNNSTILLTDRHCFCLKQSFISNEWELDWFESWSNIKDVHLDRHNKLHLQLKMMTKKNFTLNPLESSLSSPNERIIVFSANIKNQQHQKQHHIMKILSEKMSDLITSYYCSGIQNRSSESA